MVNTNEGEKTVCKVRGITLNYHASKMVNFEVTSAMILEEGDPFVNAHTEHKIKRKKNAGGTLGKVTVPEDMKYRISFFKDAECKTILPSLSVIYIYRVVLLGR